MSVLPLPWPLPGLGNTYGDQLIAFGDTQIHLNLWSCTTQISLFQRWLKQAHLVKTTLSGINHIVLVVKQVLWGQFPVFCTL